MAALIAGLLLFFIPHCISIVNHRWRDRMAQRLGAMPWQGLYSLVAIVGLGLMIWGYGQARLSPELIYQPPAFLRYVAWLLMLPVFPLLVAAYFPGKIRQRLPHPMLLATKVWATAHLLVNGMLADVLLFGSFLAWAVACRISLKRRPQRPMATAPEKPFNDIIAIVLGLLIYAVFVFGFHTTVAGVGVGL